MGARVWVHDPHSGGVKITEAVKASTERRLLAHAEKHYAGRYGRLDVRFKGALCYIDAYTEPDATGTSWKIPGRRRSSTSTAFGTHRSISVACATSGRTAGAAPSTRTATSAMSPASSGSGEMIGTPEEGLDVGAVYLTE